MPTAVTAPQQRRVWPWILAGLAVLFLLGFVIAAVIAIPKIVNREKPGRPSATESPAPPPPRPQSPDENRAPTDESLALSQLTEIEKRWTVANIEGDKNALDQILADEYRGGNPTHSKQQYLNEIRPDPSVKSWEFQDLNVDLDGDRARLDGYLRQVTTRGTEVFSFTDEFVWRAGRWQATTSRTTRVK